VNFGSGDVGGFGEGAGGEIVGFGLAVLLDGEVQIAGGDGVLERKGQLEEVGVVGLGVGREGDGEVRRAAGGARGDGVDAGAAGGGDGELFEAAGDEVRGWIESCGGIFGRKVDDVPVAAGKLLERQGGAGESVEAPLALDGAGEEDGAGFGFGCGGFGLLWGQLGVCESFGVGVGKLLGLGELDVVLRDLLEDEAALVGVSPEGDVGFGGGAGRRVEVQDHVVREAGGEDQWGTFDGQGDRGFQEAGDGVGVGGAQRGRNGFLDGGKADDEYGLGIVEGGWRVETEIEGFCLGEGDGGDVLVLRGVEAGGEADEIDDGADVSGIEAPGGEVGIACRGDEVGAGAVGESGDDRLAVAVVQK